MSTKPRKISRDTRNSTQTIFLSEKEKRGRNRPRRNKNSAAAASPKDEANMYFDDSDNNVDRKRRHQSVSFDPSLNSIASNDDSVNSNKRLQLSVGDEDNQMTEATHRSLVEAIFEVGLKHASPSVILEMMTENHQAVTSERVKSHLQKYRNNKEKSTLEFMDEYDAWMQKALTVGAAGGTFSRLASPQAVLEMVGGSAGSDSKLLGGDLPAYLTYSVMQEDSEMETAAGLQQQSQLSPSAIRNSSNEFAKYFVGAKIPFPILTEEERSTPLGVSIGHVMALFHSMTQHLMRERIAREMAEASVAESAYASATAAAGRSELSQHSVRFAQPPWEQQQQQQQQQQQHYPTQQMPHFQPSYEFAFRLGDSFYSEQSEQNEAQAEQQYHHQMPACAAAQRDSLVPQQADEDYDGEPQQKPKASSSSADDASTEILTTTGQA